MLARRRGTRAAMGLRHLDIYGAVLCASPRGGYWPPAALPGRLRRTYLVAGTEVPFFLTKPDCGRTRYAAWMATSSCPNGAARTAALSGSTSFRLWCVGLPTLTCTTL